MRNPLVSSRKVMLWIIFIMIIITIAFLIHPVRNFINILLILWAQDINQDKAYLL